MASKKAKATDPVIVHRFMKSEYAIQATERLVGKFSGALSRFPDLTPHDLRTMIRVRLYWFFVENTKEELEGKDELLRKAERWVHRGLVDFFQDEVVNLRQESYGKFTVRSLPALLREKQKASGEKSLAPEVILALREVTDHVEAEALARWLLPDQRRVLNQVPIRMPGKLRQFAERVCLAVQAHKDGDDLPALTDLPRAAQTLICYYFSDLRG